jgi:hypothetical protein
MATLRTGSYGSYYGSTYGVSGTSRALYGSEMELNAKYIYSYLSAKGWTINAISALLGNMQAESSINPGRWQSDDVGNTSLGYGLVQWTPSTKYTEWCFENSLADPSEMDNNLKRILYELENNIQWIATNSYDMSFRDFSISTMPANVLAIAFLLNYERPADQSESVQSYRGELAYNWYSFLLGFDPDTPITPIPLEKKKNYNFILFQANRRRNQWIKKH